MTMISKEEKELRNLLLKKPKIDRIGFCYRGKDRDLEYACLVLEDGRKIVSTINYTSRDGLTVGEYIQGRIDDFYDCLENNDIDGLATEFELFDEDIHYINKTNTDGYNGAFFMKV